MKKALLGLAITIGMGSCAPETCYKCQHYSSVCQVSICGGKATSDFTGTNICTSTAELSGTIYTTNDGHKNYLERKGFTCIQK